MCPCVDAPASLIIEAAVAPGAICKDEATCAMVRSTSNIFLITLYGLLILFWAQVQGILLHVVCFPHGQLASNLGRVLLRIHARIQSIAELHN